MMRRIINNSHEHPFKNQNILLLHDYPRVAYSQDKLVIKPLATKVNIESPTFLKMSHGDICGPIHTPL